MPTKPARKLSNAHKKSLAEGRTMSAAVDRYLVAVNTPGRRGRKVSKASLEARLAAARGTFKAATGVEKVKAAQDVRDCEARLLTLAAQSNGHGLKSLEAEFVKVAPKFSNNRGISYGAWRDAGVPAAVLKKAKIARTRTNRV